MKSQQPQTRKHVGMFPCLANFKYLWHIQSLAQHNPACRRFNGKAIKVNWRYLNVFSAAWRRSQVAQTLEILRNTLFACKNSLYNSACKHFSTHARPIDVIIPAEINDIIDVITDKNPCQPHNTTRSIKVYRALRQKQNPALFTIIILG